MKLHIERLVDSQDGRVLSLVDEEDAVWGEVYGETSQEAEDRAGLLVGMINAEIAMLPVGLLINRDCLVKVEVRDEEKVLVEAAMPFTARKWLIGIAMLGQEMAK